MTDRSKHSGDKGLAGLSRTRRRAHNGALDLATTLQRFGYSTGFETTKYIESFYTEHPISAAPEQREELRLRRDLCSDALKTYVTNHYTSFIATTSAVVSIEADMLRLNGLLGQFQVGLRNLQSSISFQYEDERMQAKLKSIEAAAVGAGSGAGAEGLLGAASGAGGAGVGQVEVELEELCEELRGLIYERKFEAALATLENAQDKVRRRARELEKQGGAGGGGGGGAGGSIVGAAGMQGVGGGFDATPYSPPGAGNPWGAASAAGFCSPQAGSSGAPIGGGGGSGGGSGSSGASNLPTPFQQMALDLLHLRQTLIEMLFSELRSAATSTASSSASPASPRGGKAKSGRSASASSSSSTASSSSFHLHSVITNLVALGQTRRALGTYLYQVRSAHLRAAIKGIKFTGDIVAYIQELSGKFFWGLGNTVVEFQRLFRPQLENNSSSGNNPAASASATGGSSGGGGSREDTMDNPLALSSFLMRWVLHELLHTYNAIFQKQVFQSEGTFNKLGKCLRYAFAHCQLLEARSSGGGGSGGAGSTGSGGGAGFLPGAGGTGLNLSFVLSRMFTPSLVEVITGNYRHVEQLIAEEIAVENWRVSELWVTEKEKAPHASSSAAGAAEERNAARRRKESSASASSSSSAAPSPAHSSGSGGSGAVYKKKRALKLTSSAKYLYDVVRNLLRELVPILDVGGFSSSSGSSNSSSGTSSATPAFPGSSSIPETKVSLYPTVVGGILSLFEGYLMSAVQTLKAGLYSFDDVQALSVMANAFYLNDDLLPRVIKEFKKQFCSSGSNSNSNSIPELEEFNHKLYKLYGALRASFCSKRATMLWPFDGQHLALGRLFGAGGAAGPGGNRYSNPMALVGVGAGEVASVSPEFASFAEGYLPALRVNIAKCLNAQEVEPILKASLAEFFEGLLEGMLHQNSAGAREAAAAAAAAASAGDGGPVAAAAADAAVANASASASLPTGCIWNSYMFGLGGLQQFVFDIKYLARSCGGRIGSGCSVSGSSDGAALSWDEVAPGGYLTPRAAESASALLRRCVSSYATKTQTRVDESWTKATFGWIDPAVEKRASNPKVNNLAKAYAVDKEKERADRERELETARASPVEELRGASGSTTTRPASTSTGGSSAATPSSSGIALPKSGVRRGSAITPEQLALMNAVANGEDKIDLAAQRRAAPSVSTRDRDASSADTRERRKTKD